MNRRVYVTPFSVTDEAWNMLNIIPSPELAAYSNPLIINYLKANTGKIANYWAETPWYKTIAVDIVAETVFHYPSPNPSEKIIRPLLYKRMFIYVAPPYSLKLLHKHGYKTFSPFICEDYDNIEDSHERMNAIFAEIDKLIKLPIDKVKEAMLEYKHVLEHNYQHIKTQKSRDVNNVKALLGVTS